ncbi:cation:proton antiporter [Nocardia lijiangensis]|uniref:cation:proton antiporter n=1 Tax=Nocardia lijiangensis TaxID=299618 RepID=UPI000A5CEE54|nr:cation:proton antiporter [Nocardia lijiangensis]
MDSVDLSTIAVLLLAFATVSRRLSVTITPAIFFTTAGLIAGPVLGLVELALGSSALKLLVEVTLTLVLFSDASRISLPRLRGEHTVPLRLLAIGLPLTIAAGTLTGFVVLPGVSAVEALVLAVMVACTDAALGQAVVTDERIPSRIRQGLNVESGLNDGLCVPLFFIALGLAQADEGALTEHAAVQMILEEIGYGIVGGVVAGSLGACALRIGAKRDWIEPYWRQILTVATALLSAGIAVTLHGSMFIAAFVGGLLFGTLRGDVGGPVTDLVDQSGEVFDAVTFLVFGAAILGPALDEMTWQLAVYAVLSLTVVRMVPVALSLLRTGARRQTTVFVGWFGPRGLATIVFGVLLIQEADLPNEQTLLLAATATIGMSIYAHGLTATPLTDRYIRWYRSHPEERQPPMESVPAAHHRWRTPHRAGRSAHPSRPN